LPAITAPCKGDPLALQAISPITQKNITAILMQNFFFIIVLSVL